MLSFISASDAESTLRGWTNDNLTHVNISRLLDRERNGTGDRIRWNRKAVHRRRDLGPYLRIVHRFRKVRLHEAGRNDGHAQLVACLLTQALRDGAHGELRRGIDRLIRFGDESCSRSSVDEMSKALPAEDRQCCGDAV